MRKNNHPVTWDLWLAKDWACSPATAYQLLKVVSWPDLANTTDKLWPIMLQLTIQGRKWLLRGNLKFLADGVYKRKKGLMNSVSILKSDGGSITPPILGKLRVPSCLAISSSSTSTSLEPNKNPLLGDDWPMPLQPDKDSGLDFDPSMSNIHIYSFI